MINFKIMRLAVMLALGAALCSAADDKDKGGKNATSPAGVLFSTNLPAGQPKSSPFSAEISADFIKKVMETSARIEECKKQIAERQNYLYESNPQIKAYRGQMIEMQGQINKIMETDKELADMRLNRDILWTTMPVLPKPREQQSGQGLGPRMPSVNKNVR